MTDLEAKMNELGQLLFDMDEEQRKFEEAHDEQLQRIVDLKEELRREILKNGESVQSMKLTATYRKSAVKWQTSWLDGYSLDHPEILKFRTEMKPTVAFVLRDEGWDDDGR